MTPQQRNHPKKGSSIMVEPIRSLKDIAEIEEWLQDKPRDLAMFVTGINTALRVSDLLRLKVGQVRHMKPGDSFPVKMKKTKKHIMITMNRIVYEALQPLLDASDDAPLFRSRKGGIALTEESISRMVKHWCRDCGLKGNFAAHSLRKTWAVMQLNLFGASEVDISEALGHESVKTTRRYLCIQSEKVEALFMNEVRGRAA